MDMKSQGSLERATPAQAFRQASLDNLTFTTSHTNRMPSPGSEENVWGFLVEHMWDQTFSNGGIQISLAMNHSPVPGLGYVLNSQHQERFFVRPRATC